MTITYKYIWRLHGKSSPH